MRRRAGSNPLVSWCVSLGLIVPLQLGALGCVNDTPSTDPPEDVQKFILDKIPICRTIKQVAIRAGERPPVAVCEVVEVGHGIFIEQCVKSDEKLVLRAVCGSDGMPVYTVGSHSLMLWQWIVQSLGKFLSDPVEKITDVKWADFILQLQR